MRAALVFLVLAAATTGSSAAVTHLAKLRVVDETPVTVQGLRFRAGERVRVVLYAKSRYVRTVRANRNGSFVAKFAVYTDLCTAFSLRATGASGRVAVAVKRPAPSCAALDPIP